MSESSGDWRDLYEADVFRCNGHVLPYRLLKPDTAGLGEHDRGPAPPARRDPLILYLHGAGDRGTDNTLQLLYATEILARPDYRRNYPCYVVAPQCPPDCRWVEVDWGLPSHDMPATPSVPLGLALRLVDRLATELPVDRRRLYVTGLSMGGYGAWDAVQRRPEQFAAAVPICGGGDPALAPKLKHLPIWAFHGDRDPEVPVGRTIGMIEALRRAGGKPQMTIYPGVEHDSWTRTYENPEVWAWLFRQKQRD